MTVRLRAPPPPWPRQQCEGRQQAARAWRPWREARRDHRRLWRLTCRTGGTTYERRSCESRNVDSSSRRHATTGRGWQQRLPHRRARRHRPGCCAATRPLCHLPWHDLLRCPARLAAIAPASSHPARHWPRWSRADPSPPRGEGAAVPSDGGTGDPVPRPLGAACERGHARGEPCGATRVHRAASSRRSPTAAPARAAQRRPTAPAMRRVRRARSRRRRGGGAGGGRGGVAGRCSTRRRSGHAGGPGRPRTHGGEGMAAAPRCHLTRRPPRKIVRPPTDH